MSFGLKEITIVGVIAIQIAFLGMIYASCSSGLQVCSLTKFPMISDVIADTVFDRIFILMNTAYFVGVHQVSVRSLHARFHNVISRKLNTSLLMSGLASSFSLPLIGMFDNRYFIWTHYAFALIFFLSSGWYLSHVAYIMKAHKGRLMIQNDPRISAKIDFNYRFSVLCSMSITGFILSVITFGDHSLPAGLFEWACVFLYMTLTMFIMSVFPCQDQIVIMAS